MKKMHDPFDDMLKEAVCRNHEQELQKLQDEVAQNSQEEPSEAFHRRMEQLVEEQSKKEARKRNGFLRFAAMAACCVLVLSGTVGMAYVLIGAENFRTLFDRTVTEKGIKDSPLINLNQLDEMAIQKTGVVYEDEEIRLELDGVIKSGNRLAMILKGTLLQQKDILQKDGPKLYKSYGFQNEEIETTGGWGCNINYYFSDEWDSLEKNQFLYYGIYTEDTEMSEDSYTFTFENFGWDEDVEETESDGSHQYVFHPLLEGRWSFTVTMDQEADKAKVFEPAKSVQIGSKEAKIESVELSPLACEVTLQIPYSDELVSYMDGMKLKLKNGSILEDQYYEMSVIETTIQSPEDETDLLAEDVVSFEFNAPIDISQISEIMIFETSINLE